MLCRRRAAGYVPASGANAIFAWIGDEWHRDRRAERTVVAILEG
jgi:hypothetical protein